MVSRKKVVDDPENPEWTAADFARAKKPEEVLSPDVLSVFGRKRGPQRAPKKVPVSIRLSPEVVGFFRKKGRGWQSEIDTTLKKIVLRSYKRIHKGPVQAGKRKATTPKRAAGR
jgi:uncharacterized protein (DUF4415 family)